MKTNGLTCYERIIPFFLYGGAGTFAAVETDRIDFTVNMGIKYLVPPAVTLTGWQRGLFAPLTTNIALRPVFR